MGTFNVALSEKLIAEIDTLVGAEARESLVTEATEAELRRRRMRAFLAKRQVVMKDEDHPEFAEGTAAWVRRIRSGE